MRAGSRATGTNPRALLLNPRALGTNPSAGSERDRARVGNVKRRALAVMHARGESWCAVCLDDGWHDPEYPKAGASDIRTGLVPCSCSPITSREATAYLATLAYAPTLREVERYERRRR